MAQQKTTVWEFLKNLFSKKITWIVIAAAVAIWYIYSQGKKAGAGDQANLPNSGSGIPAGWNPTIAVTTLHDAMDTGGVLGWEYGTNEDQIWAVLEPLTVDQRVAVNNEFNNKYQGESGMSLREWFEDELSGEDLTRALGYFSGVDGF